MKKTICFINGIYLPHLGGVERYIENLSKEVVRLGYDVVIITSNTELVEDKVVNDGISIYRLPVFNILKGRFPIAKPTKRFFELISEIKSLDLSVFVINMRFYSTSLIGVYLSKCMKKPAILIEHVTGYMTINSPYWDFLGHIYENIVTYFLKKNIRNFYAISKACQEWLNHFSIKSKGIIPNGVYTEYTHQSPISFKEKFNLPDNCIVISYAGRLIREKGILYLIDAFRQVSLNHPNLYLFIAGTGDLMDELQSVISDENNIILTGQIKFDEVMSLLHETDIAVLPSYYPEGLPTFILEAGINKCAVISTDIGGVSDIIPNESYGILVERKSVNAIVIAIEKMLNDPDYKMKTAEKLNKRVIENYDWRTIAKELINELEKLW